MRHADLHRRRCNTTKTALFLLLIVFFLLSLMSDVVERKQLQVRRFARALIHGVHQHYVSDSQQAPSVTRPDSLLAPASPILACSPMHRLLHLHSCNKTHVPCVHTFDTVTRQSWSIILHDITSKVQITVFGGKSLLLVFVLCILILLWSVSAILHNMNGSVSLPTESS